LGANEIKVIAKIPGINAFHDRIIWLTIFLYSPPCLSFNKWRFCSLKAEWFVILVRLYLWQFLAFARAPSSLPSQMMRIAGIHKRMKAPAGINGKTILSAIALRGKQTLIVASSGGQSWWALLHGVGRNAWRKSY
jgi:hypothetical protein